MEATAQPPPEAASDRTANTGGGVASDRLRVHAHLYKPRLKTSSIVPDFQAELRQNASKQGRNAALEYATALGEIHLARASLMDVLHPMPFACMRGCPCAPGLHVLCTRLISTLGRSLADFLVLALLIAATCGHAQAVQGGLS